jgi:hypothetical protein
MYVQQEDVFYPHLTVREHLTFQAALRLPNTLPKETKQGACVWLAPVSARASLRPCLDYHPIPPPSPTHHHHLPTPLTHTPTHTYTPNL